MDRATTRLLWAGVAAAVWYTAVVLIGGLGDPRLQPHRRARELPLYQSGAPNGTWIAALFPVDNLLIVAFGVGVFRLVSNGDGVRRRNGQAGGVALVLTAIAGQMDVVFRQDPIGSPATTAGTLHVAFAGVASLLTILAIALIASWALARPELRGFGWYSVATLAVIAVSGPVAAVATAGLWPTMGLLERLPIFGFVQWAALTSIILARCQPVSRMLPRPASVRT